jgi:hypothetical protein
VSSTTDISLLEQRQSLSRQLQAQREVIAQQLGPDPAINGYPRSRTMRFLTRQPGPLMRLILGLAAVVRLR